MRKSLIFLSLILFLILGGYFALNFWLYDAPTPCFGKKTDWTQAEIEDHFMRRAYGSAKSSGYQTYEDFINHPGTVIVFEERKSQPRNAILKGRYILSVWYENIDWKNVGIITEHNESFSKCLRYRGYFGYHFDPKENGYKVQFYNNLVKKKG